MSNILQQFAEHLAGAGLVAEHLRADGLLHRCGTTEKPHGTDGAYKACLDAPASLWWNNWRTGDTGTWCATSTKDMTSAERTALRARIAEATAAAEKKKAERRALAASTAARLWKRAAPVTGREHPYLQKKDVPSHGLRLLSNGILVVPVTDADGTLHSLQCITPDGGKRFLKGGNVAGCFFPIPAKDGGKTGPLLIAEGYATGASLHRATGHAVLVAFNAGNLLPVSQAARTLYPEREIILCADNDVETKKPDGTPWNPGIEAATAAAQAVGGKLAVCPAHEGRPTDFNDLAAWRSLEAVRLVVEAARAASPMESEKLPAGFELRAKGALPGLWHRELKEDGDPVETWIGPPLHVLGATRDENGSAWGLLLEWRDPDDTPHTWAMPKSMLVGKDNSAWLGRLADEGWSGAPGSRARKLLALYLTTYSTKRRARCVPCTGWHRSAFVLPDTVIGSHPAQNMSDVVGHVGHSHKNNELCTSDKQNTCRTLSDGLEERIVLQVQTAHNPFQTGGTPDGWRDSIGTWAKGNSRVMLALCASLAAPLLEVCGQESGGFNWVGGSSTGKTTALVAAGSVWGKGCSSGGYVRNWRATSNGLEGLAALHSDAALCLDEIGQAPGRTVMEASYMLANGMGKARAHQDGSARAARSWRCMVLSTGEKGLAEKIAEEGGRVQAGQAVRLIDIPADAGAGMGLFEETHGHNEPQAFAEALKQAAAIHYGHAARAFIGHIQRCRHTVESDLSRFLTDGIALLCPDDASGQVRRVARRFLLCAAAGEMAAEWNVLPWEKGDALNAVKSCFAAWLAMRGGTGPAEDAALLEKVMFFIEQHGTSRFQDVDNPAATCINRVGFRRKVEGGTEFLVLPESFKAEVCKGHNVRRAAEVLLEKGLLLPGDGRNLMKKPSVDLPGYGRKRCYTILIQGEGTDVVD